MNVIHVVAPSPSQTLSRVWILCSGRTDARLKSLKRWLKIAFMPNAMSAMTHGLFRLPGYVATLKSRIGGWRC